MAAAPPIRPSRKVSSFSRLVAKFKSRKDPNPDLKEWEADLLNAVQTGRRRCCFCSRKPAHKLCEHLREKKSIIKYIDVCIARGYLKENQRDLRLGAYLEVEDQDVDSVYTDSEHETPLIKKGKPPQDSGVSVQTIPKRGRGRPRRIVPTLSPVMESPPVTPEQPQGWLARLSGSFRASPAAVPLVNESCSGSDDEAPSEASTTREEEPVNVAPQGPEEVPPVGGTNEIPERPERVTRPQPSFPDLDVLDLITREREFTQSLVDSVTSANERSKKAMVDNLSMEAANRETALKAAFQKDLELTARKHDEEVRRLRNELESANAERGEQQWQQSLLTARKHDEEVRRLRNDLESANADRGEQHPTAPNLMSFEDPRQEPQNHTLGYHEEPSPIQRGGRYPGTEQASEPGNPSPHVYNRPRACYGPPMGEGPWNPYSDTRGNPHHHARLDARPSGGPDRSSPNVQSHLDQSNRPFSYEYNVSPLGNAPESTPNVGRSQGEERNQAPTPGQNAQIWETLMSTSGAMALGQVDQFDGSATSTNRFHHFRRKLEAMMDLNFPTQRLPEGPLRRAFLASCVRSRLNGTALRFVETLEDWEKKDYQVLMEKLKQRFVEPLNSAVELQKLDSVRQEGRSITEYQELVIRVLSKYIRTNSHLQSQSQMNRDSYFQAQSDVVFRKGLHTSIWKRLNERRTPEFFEDSVAECLLIERDIRAEKARSSVEKAKGRLYDVDAEESTPAEHSPRNGASRGIYQVTEETPRMNPGSAPGNAKAQQPLIQSPQGLKPPKAVIPAPHSNFNRGFNSFRSNRDGFNARGNGRGRGQFRSQRGTRDSGYQNRANRQEGGNPGWAGNTDRPSAPPYRRAWEKPKENQGDSVARKAIRMAFMEGATPQGAPYPNLIHFVKKHGSEEGHRKYKGVVGHERYAAEERYADNLGPKPEPLNGNKYPISGNSWDNTLGDLVDELGSEQGHKRYEQIIGKERYAAEENYYAGDGPKPPPYKGGGVGQEPPLPRKQPDLGPWGPPRPQRRSTDEYKENSTDQNGGARPKTDSV